MASACRVALVVFIALTGFQYGQALAKQEKVMQTSSKAGEGAAPAARRERASCPPIQAIPGIDAGFDMPVPVEDGERVLGKATLYLAPDTSPALQREELAALLAGVISEEAMQQLKRRTVTRKTITLETLCAAGLPATFDPARLSVSFDIPLAARRPGAISLTGRRQSLPEPNAKPAAFAGFANLYFGIDHVAYSDFSAPGWQTPTIALDGAIRWKDVVLEGEFGIARDFGFERRTTRLIYDLPDQALRFKAGDVRMPGIHGHAGRSLLGVSAQRSYSDLQPTRQTGPNARRSFVVYQASAVDVFVNGRKIRSFRLPPGEYELSDLPLVTGGNRIKVEVREDSGRVRTYDFTAFYDHALLKPGLSEWHVAAGFTGEYSLGGRHYALDRPALFASYQRGIFENLTGGLAVHAADGAGALDLNVTTENAFGSLFLRAAASYAGGQLGYSAGFDWQFDEFGDWSAIISAIRLSADYDSATFGPHDALEPASDALHLSAAAGLNLPLAVQGFASVNYSKDGADKPRLSASLSLSKAVGPNASWSLSTGYRTGPVLDGTDETLSEWSTRFGFSYRFSPDARLSFDHDVADRRSQIELDQRFDTAYGSWSTELELASDKSGEPDAASEIGLAGDVRYTGNRFTAAASHTRRFASPGSARIDIRSSATISTGLAFADGQVAWGRPVAGAFAIIDLPEDVDTGELQIAPSDDAALAEADLWGPALVSSLPPYMATTLPLKAQGTPETYDLGTGVFTLQPGYKAGYNLVAGTAGAMAVSGQLLDEHGEPVALAMGKARLAGAASEGPVHEFFTGKDGRFFIQGLTSGTWELSLAANSDVSFTLALSASNQKVIDVGTLQSGQAN